MILAAALLSIIVTDPEVDQAKTILGRLFEASLYSSLGRSDRFTLTTSNLRKSELLGDFALGNGQILANFRRNPIRLDNVTIRIERPAGFLLPPPLSTESITQICRNVTNSILPSSYSCLARIERITESHASYKMLAQHNATQVFTGWNMTATFDRYSGMLLSLYSAGIDYAAINPPRPWQKAISDQEGLQRALAAYAATVPFESGAVIVQDVVLSIPWWQPPSARTQYTNAHLQAWAEKRLMPFFRVQVQAQFGGEYKYQMIFVDAQTGVPTAIDLIEPGPHMGPPSPAVSKLAFVIKPGAQLTIAGTKSSIKLVHSKQGAPAGSGTNAVVLADDSAFKAILFDKSSEVVLEGKTWKYVGKPDLATVKKLKGIPLKKA